MHISLPADQEQAIGVLAPAFKAHWSPDQPQEHLAKTEAAFRACLHRDRLPLMLVAHEAGEIRGAVGLLERSVHSRPQWGPWLGALYVFAEHRRAGIGSALIAAAERRAQQLGIHTLFAGTETAVGLFRRRDWTAIDEVLESGERLTVFRWGAAESVAL